MVTYAEDVFLPPTLNLFTVAHAVTISLGQHNLHLIYRPNRWEGKMRAGISFAHKKKQTVWAGTKALIAEWALSDLRLGLEN